MIVPRAEFSLGIDRALEVVESAGPAEAVLPHIVLARPRQLDGRAELQGNGSRLDHVVVGQAPAETAAAADEVDFQLFLRDGQGLGDKILRRARRLGSRPKLDAAVAR